MMKTWFAQLYTDIGERKGVIRFVLICAIASSLLMLDQYSNIKFPDQLNRNGWIGLIVVPSLTYGLSFVSFSLVLSRKICRIIFPIILGWVFFFSIINFLTRIQFGAVLEGAGTFMILTGSSWDEVKEFFSMYFKPKWVACIVLFLLLEIILIVGLAKNTYFDVLHGRRSLFRLFLLGQLPLAVWLFISPKQGTTFFQRMKECSILRFHSFSFWITVSNEFSVFKDMTHASVDPCLPSRLDCEIDSNSSLLAVIVIGESATRNHWSLYGYERKTNPRLDSRKPFLCTFGDLVASYHHTTECLRFFLSAATKEEETCRYFLPSACKRAGYECSLLSNQVHWGRDDGAEVVFFKDCDRKYWLEDDLGKCTQDSPRHDGLLLPYIQREVASVKGNKVLFVHLIGSHYPYGLRCPGEFAAFGLDANGKIKIGITQSDHYDNSIVYTDYILNEILKCLEAQGGDSFLLYLSDHGESPRAGKWRYVKDRDVWEIPMFAWFSEGYRAHYPDVVESMYKARAKPLVSDQLLFGVTRLLRIEGVPGYTEEADFLSDAFVPRKKRYEDYVDLEEKR